MSVGFHPAAIGLMRVAAGDRAGREMSSFRWDGNACAVTVSDNHGFSLWPGFPVRSTDPRARKMAKRSGLPRLSDALEGKDAVPPLLAAWR
jgi:hypothetical protein